MCLLVGCTAAMDRRDIWRLEQIHKSAAVTNHQMVMHFGDALRCSGGSLLQDGFMPDRV